MQHNEDRSESVQHILQQITSLLNRVSLNFTAVLSSNVSFS